MDDGRWTMERRPTRLSSIVNRQSSIWMPPGPPSRVCRPRRPTLVCAPSTQPTYCSPAAELLPRQRLILGGEAARWELVRQVQALAPDCRLYNHYGPTETTVGVLTYAVPTEGETVLPSATVPLGRPLPNNQVYLLNA